MPVSAAADGEPAPEPPTRPVLPDQAIHDALFYLGAEPSVLLTQEEKQSLDQNGFVCLGQLLSPAQAAEMRRRIQKQVKREGVAAGTEVHQEGGACASNRTAIPPQPVRSDAALRAPAFNSCRGSDEV